MKIQQILDKMDQDVTGAYTVVEEKGGEVPQEATLKNLPEAIGTIPQPMPDVPLYGKVGYYPWSQARDISGDMVEIGDVDENKLDEFLDTYPSDGALEFRYEQDWESEDPESNYVWWWFWQEGELKIQPEDFASTTGINATVEEGADGASIMIEESYTVDTSAELLTTEFSSLQQFQDFSGWSESHGTPPYYVRTVGDSQVLNDSVYSIVVGREITSIPNYFIAYDKNLAEFDLSGAVVTSIGKGFLYNCQNFNNPLALDNVETIGSAFLHGCRMFNQELNIPACESIGDEFLYSCQAFNQPLDLRKVTTIGTSFLEASSGFNSPIQLQALQSVGVYFLYSCSSFNQPITVPATLNRMGTYFMHRCDSMTSAITCNCPGTVVPIDNYTLSTFDTSAPIYSTGATLTGPYASAWKSRLPDRNSSPYRKLKVA